MDETFDDKRRRAIRAVEDLGEFDQVELARLFGCDRRTVAAALKATAAKPTRKAKAKTAKPARARKTSRRG